MAEVMTTVLLAVLLAVNPAEWGRQSYTNSINRPIKVGRLFASSRLLATHC